MATVVLVVLLLEGSFVRLVSSNRFALGRCPSPTAEDEFDFTDVSILFSVLIP